MLNRKFLGKFWIFTNCKLFHNFILKYRISYEKIPQKVNFQHPLYTFCPRFRTNIDGAKEFNVTLKTTLASITDDKIVPSDFIMRVKDGYVLSNN